MRGVIPFETKVARSAVTCLAIMLQLLSHFPYFISTFKFKSS